MSPKIVIDLTAVTCYTYIGFLLFCTSTTISDIQHFVVSLKINSVIN